MPDKIDGEPGKDTGRNEPSLELPSLGWRRKRRRPESAPVEPPRPAESVEPSAPVERVEPVEPVEQPTERLAVVPESATEELAVLPESPVRVADREPGPGPELGSEPEPRPRAERGPGGMPAVVLTGLVVGLGIVGLTWASLRLCEEVQGTSSCGDTGYVLLIAILAAMIVVGALLLRVARVPEPASTSFLAVGLSAVLALVFLVDSLMDRPMVVVIPLITAGTFAAAHWVTRTFSGSPSPVE